MSTIRERIGRWLLSGTPAAQRAAPRPMVRFFDAARVDNLTFGFQSSNSSIDDDLKASLERLRGRSRNLAQNNDHMRRFLQMVTANVVGPNGFTLQCKAREGERMDDLANRMIERSFAEWARRGSCELSGQLSFADLQALVIETVARDGECIVRRVRGKSAGNKWRYSLQVLDIDRVPIEMNHAQGGNIIRMGIELNKFGRPVAYHLLPRHPGGASWQSIGTPERVPASDILHLFRPIRPEQRRGVPWAHTAMLRLEMLNKFEDAALVAARNGAERLGFFKSATGDAPLFDETDAQGNQIATSVPGSFDTLPAGYEFQPYEAQYPNDVYGHFLMWSLRSIASGLGVAYTSLANDLTNVSYSSIRAGVLEERDMWMQMQQWYSEAFLRPVFLDWVETALLSGAITYPTGSALPAAKVEKFSEHSWTPRRWAWVDPLKDVNANIAAIRAGLKSRRAVIAEQGGDLEDTWAEIAAEQALAEMLDLELEGGASSDSTDKPDGKPDDETEPEAAPETVTSSG